MNGTQQKPRVLHVVRLLDIGGLENVVLTLIRGLMAQGFENYLACLLRPGALAEQAEVRGRWCGDGDHQGRFKVLQGLCRYIKDQRINLIHTHNPHPHLFGAPAARLTGVPLVHTKHGRNFPDQPRRVWLNRQLARWTRRIVAVSDDIAAVATAIEKVPAEKVIVIRNGIDVARFMPADGCGSKGVAGYRSVGVSGCGSREEVRSRVGLPPETFVVGSVGRFSWEKDYPLLIQAFAQFHRRRPTSRLLLVGDGPDREKIERAAEIEGVKEFTLLPGMQADIRPWLSAMDVFSLSSITEGTSITLLEAAACAIPAAVVDIGGNREIVAHGVSGLVVPFGDAAGLAAAYEKLADDATLRRAMGRAAREIVTAKYAAENMIRRYADLYRHVLSARR